MHVIVLLLCLFWPTSTVIATSHACESLADIAANGDSNITSIDCHYQNGTQTIPAQLGYHSNLTSIKISCESRGCIDGTIPTELGQLQNLQSFELVGSAVNGTIPSEFGNIKLAHFSVSNAHLSGTIPESLTWNIRTLNVSYNYLTGRLSGFPNISHVELQYNLFTGRIPSGTRYKGILLPNKFVKYDRRTPEDKIYRTYHYPDPVLVCTSNSRDEPCNEEELYYFSLPSVRTGERCGEEPIENSYFEELVPTGCFLSYKEFLRYVRPFLRTEQILWGECRVHCCKGAVSKFCTRCDTNGKCVEISETITMFYYDEFSIELFFFNGYRLYGELFIAAMAVGILSFLVRLPFAIASSERKNTDSRQQEQHGIGDDEESEQNSQIPIVERAPDESDDTHMIVHNSNAESNAPIVKQDWSDQNRYVLFLALLWDCWLVWFLLASVPLCILYIQSFRAAVRSCAFDPKQPVFDFPSWSTCDQLHSYFYYDFSQSEEIEGTHGKVFTWVLRICFFSQFIFLMLVQKLALFRYMGVYLKCLSGRHDGLAKALQRYPNYFKLQGAWRTTRFATFMRILNHNPICNMLRLMFGLVLMGEGSISDSLREDLVWIEELLRNADGSIQRCFAKLLFTLVFLGAIGGKILPILFPSLLLVVLAVALPGSIGWKPYWYGITMIQDVTRFDDPKLLQVAIDADMPRHVNEDVWYVLSRKYSGSKKKQNTLEIVKMLIDDQKGYDNDWKPSSSLLLDCRQRNKSILELAECWDNDQLIELVKNGNHSEQFVDEVEQEDNLTSF